MSLSKERTFARLRNVWRNVVKTKQYHTHSETMNGSIWYLLYFQFFVLSIEPKIATKFHWECQLLDYRCTQTHLKRTLLFSLALPHSLFHLIEYIVKTHLGYQFLVVSLSLWSWMLTSNSNDDDSSQTKHKGFIFINETEEKKNTEDAQISLSMSLSLTKWYTVGPLFSESHAFLYIKIKMMMRDIFSQANNKHEFMNTTLEQSWLFFFAAAYSCSTAVIANRTHKLRAIVNTFSSLCLFIILFSFLFFFG